MRNTTRDNKRLNLTLIAGAFALALIAPVHAQVLGGGGLGGGLAGGLNGPMTSTMGQLGGSARGMGRLDPPAVGTMGLPSRAERLHGRAASVAARGAHTLTRELGQPNGAAVPGAVGNLPAAAGASAGQDGHAALNGTAALESSAAGALDASATRQAATGAAGQALARMHGAASSARNAAADAASRARGAASEGAGSAQGLTTLAAAQRPSTHAAGTLGSGVVGAAQSPSVAGTPAVPGLPSALPGSKAPAIDLSGAAHGNAHGRADGAAGSSAIPGSQAASRAAGAAHADGQADAHGSARDGVSASARASGGADASMSAQH